MKFGLCAGTWRQNEKKEKEDERKKGRKISVLHSACLDFYTILLPRHSEKEDFSSIDEFKHQMGTLNGYGCYKCT